MRTTVATQTEPNTKTMGKPKVVTNEDFSPQGFRWLKVKRLSYVDAQGRKRFWESAERSTRATCGVDAVAVYARCISKQAEDQLVLVSQFRPPLDSSVLELPAGLIDEGETASEAALRELREETGLVGSAVSESRVLYSDPGMSNANMKLVEVLVDMDLEQNKRPKQHLEDGEDITVHMVGANDFLGNLQELSDKQGHVIDARLWAIAFGRQTKAMETIFNPLEQFKVENLHLAMAVFLSTAVVGALVKACFTSRN